MREITGVWLARDRKRIAIQLDEENIVITCHGLRAVDYEVDHLPRDEWDELFPETDFS